MGCRGQSLAAQQGAARTSTACAQMDSTGVWQLLISCLSCVQHEGQAVGNCMLTVYATAAHPRKVQSLHCRVQGRSTTCTAGQLLPELSCHILLECLCSSAMSSVDEACPCCSPGKGTVDALQGAQGRPSQHRRAATA